MQNDGVLSGSQPTANSWLCSAPQFSSDAVELLRRANIPISMLHSLFRRKPMDQLAAEAEDPEHRLKIALGPIDVTALGIGAIIGAGIFATIGTASAGDVTRPGAG